ncbi:cytochrome o ubiquinol oxidase subunit IV [Buchnera aphidicola]|uniref:Cytochrome bo(3) ubiquinol oxidase subunit 4 n=1 Tax=Buchnera aphidicola (Stegophylla sp.) TaxID=2315800 RepID=A0A4D6YN35_9GAMM|nr:cytochrome o ubiquinol oxidase subunit IV [Buchnera aphidicola (Stegophylla sp.)]QCI26445.1 cytochrome o ubiquinol oxidase subunit IV [Buchnera aphidicola (Stegophylla sp.)]
MNSINNYNSLNSSIKMYILGYFISLILTIIPFFLVMKRDYCYSKRILIIVLILSLLLQIFVHCKYFLHLNFSKKYYWNYIFLIFSIIVICIIVLGSIWIMKGLQNNLCGS